MDSVAIGCASEESLMAVLMIELWLKLQLK